MVKDNIIEPVDEPTEWVNSLVVIEKPKRSIRLCIDPHDLNRAVQLEHYPVKAVEEVAAKLAGAKLFRVLDAEQAYLLPGQGR